MTVIAHESAVEIDTRLAARAAATKTAFEFIDAQPNNNDLGLIAAARAAHRDGESAAHEFIVEMLANLRTAAATARTNKDRF